MTNETAHPLLQPYELGDLAERLRRNLPFAKYDRDVFWGGDHRRHVDYLPHQQREHLLQLTAAGRRREDAFINLVEVTKENWSFGNGEAQYAAAPKRTLAAHDYRSQRKERSHRPQCVRVREER
jgi:hypothetical protein